EPEVYGSRTLKDIEAMCIARGKALGLTVDFRQSNAESEIVQWIQDARQSSAGIIINPAAYTHTSVAILDALLACDLPSVEVHLSNIHKREEFRHHSYVSKAANGIIAGFGAKGYELAIEAIADLLPTAK
ncbi:MAG: 3-dehydroquinate dehydratase, partial [Rhodospirillales bacterium]|nr:3-dehydroquinate dehydratase [Rhodospirillales bacterium]